MFFSSLKEAHNICCKKEYEWIGCPYMNKSVSAYKCKQCGIEFWQIRHQGKTIRKVPSEFMSDETIQNLMRGN